MKAPTTSDAFKRSTVRVVRPDKPVILATLMGVRNRSSTARVRLVSGAWLSVPIDQLEVVPSRLALNASDVHSGSGNERDREAASTAPGPLPTGTRKEGSTVTDTHDSDSGHLVKREADSVLTGAQHVAMLKARDSLQATLSRSLEEHGVSEARMPLVYRDLRMRAASLAARNDVFHVGEDEIAKLERRSLGHSDYASKFPLHIAQRMWGVI